MSGERSEDRTARALAVPDFTKGSAPVVESKDVDAPGEEIRIDRSSTFVRHLKELSASLHHERYGRKLLSRSDAGCCKID